ncbi:hypothetical protein DPEC_G00337210 [Dallia pectoralis]|uniref:Uncharacterized protein n=1 Tax=Dallia pectoralis TaxID=75939 RepID=A0ACC2F7A9_DALPE|nr:hypothetical protein DPEC_G00337210 [Dallia pectoralis]
MISVMVQEKAGVSMETKRNVALLHSQLGMPQDNHSISLLSVHASPILPEHVKWYPYALMLMGEMCKGRDLERTATVPYRGGRDFICSDTSIHKCPPDALR